jgi:hypothetical protein
MAVYVHLPRKAGSLCVLQSLEYGLRSSLRTQDFLVPPLLNAYGFLSISIPASCAQNGLNAVLRTA